MNPQSRNRKVWIYDNGGETIDRYTVLVFRTARYHRIADVYSMGSDPRGFNQFSHTIDPWHRFAYVPAWGKRVKFDSLTKELQAAIMERI